MKDCLPSLLATRPASRGTDHPDIAGDGHLVHRAFHIIPHGTGRAELPTIVCPDHQWAVPRERASGNPYNRDLHITDVHVIDIDLLQVVPSGDLDADLRVALLALSVGGKRRLAADFLKQSAAKKLTALDALEEHADCASGSPLADWYTRLRSKSVSAVLQAEHATAISIGEALPKNLPRRLRR